MSCRGPNGFRVLPSESITGQPRGWYFATARPSKPAEARVTHTGVERLRWCEDDGEGGTRTGADLQPAAHLAGQLGNQTQAQ